MPTRQTTPAQPDATAQSNPALPGPDDDPFTQVTREELAAIGRAERARVAAALDNPAHPEPTRADKPLPPPPAPTVRNVDTQLSAFQAELPNVAAGEEANVPGKDGKQGYKYRYAGLDSVSQTVLRLLGKHGLAWRCTLEINDRGNYVLTGTLVHGESGTSVCSQWKVPDGTPQAVGSSLTYGRRYLLLAATGVAPGGEDDDGAKAEEAAAEDRMARRREEALAREAERLRRNVVTVTTGSRDVSLSSPGTGPARAAVAEAVTERGNLGDGRRTGNPAALPTPEDKGLATPAQAGAMQGLRTAVDHAWLNDRAAMIYGKDDPTAGLLPAATAYAEVAERKLAGEPFSDSERVPEAIRGVTPREAYLSRMTHVCIVARHRDSLTNIIAALKVAGELEGMQALITERWRDLAPGKVAVDPFEPIADGYEQSGEVGDNWPGPEDVGDQ